MSPRSPDPALASPDIAAGRARLLDGAVWRRTLMGLGAIGFAPTLASPGTASALENDSQVVEGNKALVGRLLDEGLIDGNQTIVSELYAPGFVGRDGWARQMPGPVGLPMSRTDYKIAFPDLTVTLDAIVAEGDIVATHESRWSSHPPTGTHLEGQTMHLARIANGQIVERWRSGWDWFPRAGDSRNCDAAIRSSVTEGKSSHGIDACKRGEHG